jgi:uncharacterized membrane protein YkvI
MVAWYPEIAGETLPSDFLLQRMNQPVFHVVFQLMIFSALLESGTGGAHAINERIAQAYRARRQRELSTRARLAFTGVLLLVAIFLADRFGLVTLIARGYRALGFVLIGVYVLPLLTYGVWRLVRGEARASAEVT